LNRRTAQKLPGKKIFEKEWGYDFGISTNGKGKRGPALRKLKDRGVEEKSRERGVAWITWLENSGNGEVGKGYIEKRGGESM